MLNQLQELKFNLNKTIAILVSGKAGVGKTTFSNFALDYLKSIDKEDGEFIILNSFANGVKETAIGIGWDGKKDSKGRKLLQDIGRIGREYWEDIWIYKSLKMIGQGIIPKNIIIYDDWRFPNEADFFLGKSLVFSTYLVRIESPDRETLKDTKEYNDVSETSLPSFDENPIYYNYSVKNDKLTLDQLNIFTISIVKDILKKEINYE